jgi:hypothetical protein
MAAVTEHSTSRVLRPSDYKDCELLDWRITPVDAGTPEVYFGRYRRGSS